MSSRLPSSASARLEAQSSSHLQPSLKFKSGGHSRLIFFAPSSRRRVRDDPLAPTSSVLNRCLATAMRTKRPCRAPGGLARNAKSHVGLERTIAPGLDITFPMRVQDMKRERAVAKRDRPASHHIHCSRRRFMRNWHLYWRLFFFISFRISGQMARAQQWKEKFSKRD